MAGFAAFAAQPVVQYATLRHVEPDSTGKARPDQTASVTATLGADYLRIDEPDVGVIYDFTRHRLLRLDNASHSYTDGSLYEDAGFRAIELRHRIGLGSALEAGKVAANPITALLSEHATGLSAESGPAGISEKHGAKLRVFAAQGRRLYAVSDEVAPLPAEAQRAFWRFVRYYLSGHPAIYERLVGTAGAPRHIERHLAGIDASTTTLTLTGVDLLEDAPYSLEGWRLAGTDSEPAATVALLGASPATKVAPYVAATRAARDAAADGHQVLNALLANLELVFIGDDQDALTVWLRDHHDAIDADPEAKAVLQTFAAASPADHSAAAAAIEAVRRVDPAHRYLLDVLASNHLASAEQPTEAIERMLRVLHEHPLLVGPWTDLGGMYLAQFDTHSAWLCWDAARAIQPAHPMVASINRFEAMLRTKAADYF